MHDGLDGLARRDHRRHAACRSATTRTCTAPSSRRSSPRSAPSSAASCAPGAAATTRSRRWCGCTCSITRARSRATSCAWSTRSSHRPKRIPTAIMPGRTHLQHAQPVLLAHHLQAHAWPLVRDLERLRDWSVRARSRRTAGERSPDRRSGSTRSSSRASSASRRPPRTRSTAPSARDVVAEFAFIAAMIGVDLSRFAEEIILWNTREFGFVTLDDGVLDRVEHHAAEEEPRHRRARTRQVRAPHRQPRRACSRRSKALPLAYNRDLQEDKEPVFDSVRTLEVLLPAFAGMVATLRFDTERMAQLAPQGFSLATDVAEWLVKRGVPFRDAHEISGALVKLCEERGHRAARGDRRDARLGLAAPDAAMCARCSRSRARSRAATASAAPRRCGSRSSAPS